MAFFHTSALRRVRRSFHRKADGSMSVEAMLVMPLILTALMMSYGFYSAFDAKMRANKAAYTLADYITRQTDAVTPEFVEGMAEMYKFLNNKRDISLRVSAVRWSTANTDAGEYELVWSSGMGDLAALDGASDIESRLPLLSNGSEVVVVETIRPWSTPFNIGLDSIKFSDVVTTQPRFATQVLYEDGSTTTSAPSGHVVADVTGDAGSLGGG